MASCALVDIKRARNLIHIVVVTIVVAVAGLVAYSTAEYSSAGLVESLNSLYKATYPIYSEKLCSELTSNVACTILALLLPKYLTGLRLNSCIYILYT